MKLIPDNHRRTCGTVRPLFCLNAVWILLFMAGMGWFMIGMPSMTDDYWFASFLADWLRSRGAVYNGEYVDMARYGMPLSAVADSWQFRILHDNSRLCNLVAVVVLLFPKWLGSGFAVLSLFYVVMKFFALAGLDWRRSLLVPLGLALLTFTLPWHEQMWVRVFQFNYIVGAALSFLLIDRLRPLFRGGVISHRRLLFFLAFVVGWWQEGFSIPVFVALTAVVLFYPSLRSGTLYAVMSAMLAGSLLIVLNPVHWQRYSGGIIFTDRFSVWFTVFMVSNWPVFFVVTVWALGLFLSRRCSPAEVSPFWFFFYVAAAVSLLVVYIGGAPPRAGIFCSLCSALLLLKLMSVSFRSVSVWWRLPAAVANCLLIFLITVRLWSVDSEIAPIRRNLQLAEMVCHSDSSVSCFAKIRTLEDYPLINGYLPDAEFYTDHLSDRRKYPDRYNVAIIPEELEYVTPESGSSVPGRLGVRCVGGRLYLQSDTLPASRLTVAADLGHGDIRYVVRAVPFRSKADGRRYLWLAPCNNWYVTHFKTIRTINEIREIADR